MAGKLPPNLNAVLANHQAGHVPAFLCLGFGGWGNCTLLESRWHMMTSKAWVRSSRATLRGMLLNGKVQNKTGYGLGLVGFIFVTELLGVHWGKYG